MKKLAAVITLVAGMSLALTACGPTGSTVNLEVSDSGLAPKTLNVPVGANVTFTVKNRRTEVYDCHLRDVSQLKLYPGQIFWMLNSIPAGATKTDTFAAPSQPTTYEIGCGVSPYASLEGTAAGMTATLVVK
jgi:plastocyanin